MPGAVVTLTTDFGLADAYVAAMKGVILQVNPEATLVDISHEVQPQQVRQVLFLTQSAWPYFAPGTVHVVVVDPGVGTARLPLVLETPRGVFVGPDNGALSAALPEDSRPEAAAGPLPAALPAGHRAVAITDPRFFHGPVSATFHGRDIFAPVAAHLSLGVTLSELGDPLETVLAFPPLRAAHRPGGELAGHVVHLDRFGNVITDARADDLPAGAFEVELCGRRAPGPVTTYAEASGLAALVGSSGYVEVTLPQASAAAALQARLGDPVTLRPVPPRPVC